MTIFFTDVPDEVAKMRVELGNKILHLQNELRHLRQDRARQRAKLRYLRTKLKCPHPRPQNYTLEDAIHYCKRNLSTEAYYFFKVQMYIAKKPRWNEKSLQVAMIANKCGKSVYNSLSKMYKFPCAATLRRFENPTDSTIESSGVQLQPRREKSNKKSDLVSISKCGLVAPLVLAQQQYSVSRKNKTVAQVLQEFLGKQEAATEGSILENIQDEEVIVGIDSDHVVADLDDATGANHDQDTSPTSVFAVIENNRSSTRFGDSTNSTTDYLSSTAAPPMSPPPPSHPSPSAPPPGDDSSDNVNDDYDDDDDDNLLNLRHHHSAPSMPSIDNIVVTAGDDVLGDDSVAVVGSGGSRGSSNSSGREDSRLVVSGSLVESMVTNNHNHTLNFTVTAGMVAGSHNNHHILPKTLVVGSSASPSNNSVLTSSAGDLNGSDAATLAVGSSCLASNAGEQQNMATAPTTYINVKPMHMEDGTLAYMFDN